MCIRDRDKTQGPVRAFISPGTISNGVTRSKNMVFRSECESVVEIQFCLLEAPQPLRRVVEGISKTYCNAVFTLEAACSRADKVSKY